MVREKTSLIRQVFLDSLSRMSDGAASMVVAQERTMQTIADNVTEILPIQADPIGLGNLADFDAPLWRAETEPTPSRAAFDPTALATALAYGMGPIATGLGESLANLAQGSVRVSLTQVPNGPSIVVSLDGTWGETDADLATRALASIGATSGLQGSAAPAWWPTGEALACDGWLATIAR